MLVPLALSAWVSAGVSAFQPFTVTQYLRLSSSCPRVPASTTQSQSPWVLGFGDGSTPLLVSVSGRVSRAGSGSASLTHGPVIGKAAVFLDGGERQEPVSLEENRGLPRAGRSGSV